MILFIGEYGEIKSLKIKIILLESDLIFRTQKINLISLPFILSKLFRVYLIVNKSHMYTKIKRKIFNVTRHDEPHILQTMLVIRYRSMLNPIIKKK